MEMKSEDKLIKIDWDAGVVRICNVPHQRNTFTYLGHVVEEYVFTDPRKNSTRIVWVRDSLETMKVGGKDNMLVHVEVPAGVLDQELWREQVKVAYDKYWGLDGDKYRDDQRLKTQCGVMMEK